MKKALFMALLAVGLMACNNTKTSIERSDISSAPEQTTYSLEPDALLGSVITTDGLGNLKIGSKIPDTIPGYEIKPVTIIYEEDIEDLEFQVLKNGDKVLVLHPTYEDESDVPSDRIRGITIYSDQYVTPDEFHVGSNVQDILEKQGVKTSFNEENFLINDGGILYVLSPDDYESALPEVPFDNPVEVEHPSFKTNAQVRMIQIFGPID